MSNYPAGWYQSKVVQRTKANHNMVSKCRSSSLLVSIKSSSKNESKSQQADSTILVASCWYQSKVVQRTKANHNTSYLLIVIQKVGINQKQFKERKQITTSKAGNPVLRALVSIKSSSKNESKSQQSLIKKMPLRVGINQKQFKERKQITTRQVSLPA